MAIIKMFFDSNSIIFISQVEAMASFNYCPYQDLEHINSYLFQQFLSHAIHFTQKNSYILFTQSIHVVSSPFTILLHNHDMHPPNCSLTLTTSPHTFNHHSNLSTMRPTSLTQKLLLLFHNVCVHSPISNCNVTRPFEGSR